MFNDATKSTRHALKASFVLLSLQASALAESRPNILFMFTDDHAQRAISAYPESLNETPNLDRIANEGMMFAESFVCNSICGPARAAILTGKHSHLNGFRKNDDKFDGGQQTFPKLLQSSGYQTALIGKWHLATEPTGFDHWEILPNQGHYYNPDFIKMDGSTVTEKGYVTDMLADKGIEWIENRNKEKPFMLMLQHKAPHREWMPALRHLSLYDDVTIPEPDNLFDDYNTRGKAARNQDMSIEITMSLTGDNKVWELDDSKPNLWTYNLGRMTEDELAQWNAAYGPKNKKFLDAKLEGKELVRWKYQRYLKDYLRCIAAVDESVGKVLDYLDDSGLADNTVVIYSSDQGFYLGEHGWFDKRFMYEESMRTPLLIRWPGVTKPGSVCNELVQNIDYAETFLELAGVEIPADMQGKSLVPLLKGKTPADWRDSLYYHYYAGDETWHRVAKHEGIRGKRFKLINFYTHNEWELYDLEKDPKEMNNLYNNPEYAGKIKELKSQLDEIKSKYDAQDTIEK